MTDEIQFPQTPFPLPQALILLGRRGSEAHGLYTPSSDPDHIDDRDLMGIVVPPRTYYLGLKQWEVVEGINGCWDVVLYELKKFVLLLMKQNPNVISLLWNDEEDILSRSVEGLVLRENRDLFRHAEYARTAFIGYAMGQLKRMTAFDADAMQQISEIEQRLLEYGINLGHAAEGKLRNERPEVQAWVDRYVGLRRTYHKAYMGAKRWSLVQKVGFDCKNAKHMVQLLHLGHEYLTQGKIFVKRTWDRDMLLEIKRGEWEIGRVKEHANAWFEKLKDAKSVLPGAIDEHQVEQLVLYILTNRLGLNDQGPVIR